MMNNDDHNARAKMIMGRIVSEKIPQAERWSVPGAFKSWIDALSAEEFKTYMDRLSGLTRHLSDEDLPQKTGVFISGKAYPKDKMAAKQRLDLVGGEACAYYALALWRTLEAEELVGQLRASE